MGHFGAGYKVSAILTVEYFPPRVSLLRDKTGADSASSG